jgi:hypothetical protein
MNNEELRVNDTDKKETKWSWKTKS